MSYDDEPVNEGTNVSVLRRSANVQGECWVAVDGNLDAPTSQRLQDQVEVLLKEGCRSLVVDLRQTLVIEAPGLRVLAEALRRLEELGGGLVLRTPPGQAYALGRLRRLGELVAAVDAAIDEADAIGRLDGLLS